MSPSPEVRGLVEVDRRGFHGVVCLSMDLQSVLNSQRRPLPLDSLWPKRCLSWAFLTVLVVFTSILNYFISVLNASRYSKAGSLTTCRWCGTYREDTGISCRSLRLE